MCQKKIAFCFEGINNRVWDIDKLLLDSQKQAVRCYSQRAKSIMGIDYYEELLQGKSADEFQNGCVELVMTYICSCVIFESYVEEGIKPDILIGFSLGLNSACVCAGSLTFEEGLAILIEIIKAMEYSRQHYEYGMALEVGLSSYDVEKLLKKNHMENSIEIASENSEYCVLLTGDKRAMNDMKTEFMEAGVLKYNIMNSYFPFHYKKELWMDDILKRIDSFATQNSKYSIFSAYTLEVFQGINTISEELKKNVYEKMRWRKSMSRLEDLGYYTFWDVGLTGSNKKITVLNNEVSEFYTLKNYKRRIKSKLLNT